MRRSNIWSEQILHRGAADADRVGDHSDAALLFDHEKNEQKKKENYLIIKILFIIVLMIKIMKDELSIVMEMMTAIEKEHYT